jgi:hypothetical protein
MSALKHEDPKAWANGGAVSYSFTLGESRAFHNRSLIRVAKGHAAVLDGDEIVVLGGTKHKHEVESSEVTVVALGSVQVVAI